MAWAVRVAHGPPRLLSRTVGWVARRRWVRPGEAERSHATRLLRQVRSAESRRGQVLLVLRDPADRAGAARIGNAGRAGHYRRLFGGPAPRHPARGCLRQPPRQGRPGLRMTSEPSAGGHFGIGEVLAQLQPESPDISTSKIRFLEAEGLIEPARSRSGYRRFSADDIERLRYILTIQRDS